jgi:hypothetical protein
MFAQGTAQLTGRITDATAAVVPAAAVSVINTETGARRKYRIERHRILHGRRIAARKLSDHGASSLRHECASYRMAAATSQEVPMTRREIMLMAGGAATAAAQEAPCGLA